MSEVTIALARATKLNQFQKLLLKSETIKELCFTLANTSKVVVPYKTMVVYCRKGTNVHLEAISGRSEINVDGEVEVALKAQIVAMISDPDKVIPTMPIKVDLDGELNAYASTSGYGLEQESAGRIMGIMLFSDTEITSQDLNIATEMLSFAMLVSDKLIGKAGTSGVWQTIIRKKRYIAAALLLLSLIPIPETVSAPAEISSEGSVVIRSPLAGTIESVSVDDNQRVTAGNHLLSFEAQQLLDQITITQQDINRVNSEFRKLSQQSIKNERYQAELKEVSLEKDIKEAQLNYYETQLALTKVLSPNDGLVIMPNKTSMVGRAYAVGEEILTLMDPDKKIIEAYVPVSDAIALDMGTRVRMFLNVSPSDPIEATIIYASYMAETVPEGYLAFRVKAVINDGEKDPRIGLRGTAKILGPSRPILFQIFRRPVALTRQYFGI